MYLIVKELAVDEILISVYSPHTSVRVIPGILTHTGWVAVLQCENNFNKPAETFHTPKPCTFCNTHLVFFLPQKILFASISTVAQLTLQNKVYAIAMLICFRYLLIFLFCLINAAMLSHQEDGLFI